MVDLLHSSLNLMRRLPPSHISKNLIGLSNLIPELADEFSQRVDQPLEIEMDAETGKEFLKCEYNRDGDSFRSPWSNKYFPAAEEGYYPSPELRQLEVSANHVFDVYRHMYYEGGVSSVYIWELEDNNFAANFLIHKDVEGTRGVDAGTWDSSHVFEVRIEGKSKVTYRLTSSVILKMKIKNEQIGDLDLSGTLNRQDKAEETMATDRPGTEFHIQSMGSMVEKMEGNLRSALDTVYLQKTKEVLARTRVTGKEYEMAPEYKNIMAGIQEQFKNRG